VSISPRLRAALHEALDLVLNAMEEEGYVPAPKPKVKRSRGVLSMTVPVPEMDEITRRRAENALRRAGLR
jgi:hypothetical protein